MKSRIAIALLAVAVLAFGAAVFFAVFKREWRTEITAASGEARYNRFYALQGVLQNMGQRASSGIELGKILPGLRPGDTVVIGDDIGRIAPGEASALAGWVRTGGHLVISPPAYASHDVPLLDQLDLLTAQKGSPACTMLAADTGTDTMRLCGSGFHLQAQALARADVRLGDNAGNGLLFARVPEGKGVVSLLSDMNVLAGTSLKKTAQQEFVWRLLAPNLGRGDYYLLYELIGASFWVSLFVHGWPALIASLLLVLGWMAARSERLGPLAPVPAMHRRALLEHIQATGEFLFRRDGGRSLHRLACEAVLARLHRSDPASTILNKDELYAWLAQRSRLDPAHIEQAFQSPANATAFRGSMTTLARLRSHL